MSLINGVEYPFNPNIDPSDLSVSYFQRFAMGFCYERAIFLLAHELRKLGSDIEIVLGERSYEDEQPGDSTDKSKLAQYYHEKAMNMCRETSE